MAIFEIITCDLDIALCSYLHYTIKGDDIWQFIVVIYGKRIDRQKL